MAPQNPRVLGTCPSETDLICATSGELPPAEWAIVRQHLAHCPMCRSRMRAILNTLATLAQLTGPDSPERLRAGRERLEELMATARAEREAMSPRRWLAAAAVLVALVVGIARFGTDPLDADEVVARAAAREIAVTMPADLWLWTFVPAADGQTSANGANTANSANSAANATSAPGATGAARATSPTGGNDGAWIPPGHAALPPRAVQMLQKHGFDLVHPLSLARLQTWRAAHPDRREQLAHQDEWFVVTSTTRGQVSEVELVIDKANYQLVKQTWLIAGMGRVVCERVRLDRRSGVPPRDASRSEPAR